METLLLLRKNARKRSMLVFSFDNIKTDDSVDILYWVSKCSNNDGSV